MCVMKYERCDHINMVFTELIDKGGARFCGTQSLYIFGEPIWIKEYKNIKKPLGAGLETQSEAAAFLAYW